MGIADLFQSGFCGFPILTIKFYDIWCQSVSGVQTIIMHAPAIRMGSWLVEALDSTMAAEQMIGLTAAKSIAGEIILAAQQRKIAVRNDQVQIAGSRADRAIAVEQFRRVLDIRLKAHGAAVTAPRNFGHSRTSVV